MYHKTITKIEPDGIEECYDLTVPNEHNFFLGNGVLSHNCITGMEGCITGDSKIRIHRLGVGKEYPIKYLYQQIHKQKEIKKSDRWKKGKIRVRSYNGKEVRLHNINDIVYSGKKEVFELSLKNGLKIKLTANHKVMTRKGFIELQNLTKKDEVMCDEIHTRKKGRKMVKVRDLSLRVPHPYHKRPLVAKLILEARMNNLKFIKYLDILLNEKEIAKTLKYVNPKIHAIHHKDGNHYNNSLDNLSAVLLKDHYINHGMYENFSQGLPYFSNVKAITKLGIEDTYDIQCKEPYHNFSANGMIIHNSGKSTAVMSIAKYVDPTFPGMPLNDGTTRRTCERIVFSAEDLMKQIDKSKPGQAIVFDEAVMGFMAADASSEIQKILVKKMVTIRKKRLYIFIVIPSLFLLRKYMAVFRTRALIHFYSPDGLARGCFKFYSYDTKRALYFKGYKEFNQGAVREDFKGTATNTEGFFFDIYEYEAKKDKAILSLTSKKSKKEQNQENKEIIYKGQRDALLYYMFQKEKQSNPKFNFKVFSEILQKQLGNGLYFTSGQLPGIKRNGLTYIEENWKLEIKAKQIKDIEKKLSRIKF